jgi:hypothetical protein
MPDQNQTNQNQGNTQSPQTDSSSVPPVFSPNADLPPLPPEFQTDAGVPAAPTGTTTTTTQTTTTPATPSNINEESGSAAPLDIPPMTTSGPKKKFGGGRIIATILGIFLLVGGIAGGVILTQRQQLLESQAVAAGACNCVNANGVNAGAGTCQGTNCICGAGLSVKANRCGETAGGGGGQQVECNNGSYDYRCTSLGSTTCQAGNTGYQCTCIDTSPGTCYKWQWQCNVVNTQACPISGDSSGGSGYCGNNTCTVPAVTSSCWVSHYTSGNKDDPVVNDNVVKEYVRTATLGATSCGAEQIDVYCNGNEENISRRYSTNCGGGGGTEATAPPGTTTTTAQCQNVKAYNTDWEELSSTQLTTLTAGNNVNFCVVGSATGGSFDKARFTINGTLMAETTAKRPSAQDYCQTYTIPAGVTTFNVSAQIHHASLGWK